MSEAEMVQRGVMHPLPDLSESLGLTSYPLWILWKDPNPDRGDDANRELVIVDISPEGIVEHYEIYDEVTGEFLEAGDVPVEFSSPQDFEEMYCR